ncbi:MAG: DUF3303 domain-containing protein [Candidatus Electrothrix sp. AUS4]|nr:DUF3303 domain-containing protein [Candidatus Electrothrix sp. AUS4]
MKFMISWKIAPEDRKSAAEAFLRGGAPMPEGLTLLGRWHAPGSSYGWILVEADDLGPVALHTAEWGDFLDLQTTPVLEDEAAGQALSQVYGS